MEPEKEVRVPEELTKKPETYFLDELFGSYLNIFLLVFCLILLYKIIRTSMESSTPPEPRQPSLPPMKKRDYRIEELKPYDGNGAGDTQGRILMAVNRNVFDVTTGRSFYGPGGPYGVFAGRDASRGLAKFSVEDSVIRDDYDDLGDLTPSEWDSLREWEKQFHEKYSIVGRLLAPGESPANYSDASDTEDEAVGDKKKN